MKIVVVDDDPDIRALLSAWLRSNGCEVMLGADGYQAVQLARSSQPDLIMLDIRLPAADGFTVQARLRRLPSVSGVPIISISADPRAGAAAIAAGARRFLPKPLDKAGVLAAVRDLCPQTPA